MADERQDADRAERDHERTAEVHWQAAEAEAAEADERTQKTTKGLEIPVRKKKGVFDDSERAAKPDSDASSRAPEK